MKVFLKVYLRHGIVVRLLLWVSPIDNNITAPNLDSTSFQSAFGKTSRFVGFIFQEAETSAKNKNLLRETCTYGYFVMIGIYLFFFLSSGEL
jgi:hypothetical protein